MESPCKGVACRMDRTNDIQQEAWRIQYAMLGRSLESNARWQGYAMTQSQIEEIQAALQARNIPAWLFCDHHHRDAICVSPQSKSHQDLFLLTDRKSTRLNSQSRQYLVC